MVPRWYPNRILHDNTRGLPLRYLYEPTGWDRSPARDKYCRQRDQCRLGAWQWIKVKASRIIGPRGFRYFASNPNAGIGASSSLYNQLSKNSLSSSPLTSSATAIKSAVRAFPSANRSWYVFRISKNVSSP